MRVAFYRYTPWALLGLHLLLRAIFPNPNVALDLVLYNAVGICAAMVIISSDDLSDGPGKKLVISGLIFWLTGSMISTYSEFFSRPHFSQTTANALYMALYPCLILGLVRAIRGVQKFAIIELLDASIIGIGVAAIGTAFILDPVLPHFSGDLSGAIFAVAFPIADLALLGIVVALALMDTFSVRNTILLCGIAVFTLSDFLFLSLTIHGRYTFGEFSDDGWLLGLILIAEGFRHSPNDPKKTHSLHPAFIAISVMTSAVFLGVTSLRPRFFPSYIVIPTVLTLILAFIRMTIALREASAIGEERLLARTDELTGLPNRRKFVAELSLLTQNPKNKGALLLLDLDGFKPINDQYGHEVGDQLLRQVSVRFLRALPHGSLLARLGGDEFGALILGDYESTLEVALALKATLSYPFSLGGREIMVGVSVGHVNNDGGSDLLRRADQAMYQAKRERVGVWSEPARN